MGRGRAKAKQTKVARELKYSSPTTDLTALERELSGGEDSPAQRGAQGLDSTGIDDTGRGDSGLDDSDEYGDYGDDRWASSR